MALSDVTKQDVLAAIREYSRIGKEHFLETYRFREGDYWLIYDGNRYASKAILGVAHDKFTCERINSTHYITRWRLSPGHGRFSGGEQTKKTLKDLGFEIVKDSHSQEGGTTGIYQWVPWFEALADKIAGIENKDVIARARQVRWSKNGEVPALLRQDDAHFDPLSFFYYIASRSKFAAGRNLIYPSISKAFNIFQLGNLDSDDAFVFPTPRAHNVLFNDIANKGPRASNPNLLWKLFRSALSGANKVDGSMFDRALDIPYVAVTKLTQALFLINPREFVPLDSSLTLTKSVLPNKPLWREYQEESAKVRRMLPGCQLYEINLAGYLLGRGGMTVHADRYFHISSRVTGDDTDHWQDFESSNSVYTNVGKDESGSDQPYFLKNLRTVRAGDIVLVRFGVQAGRGIGIVRKNDYLESENENNRLHVFWLNKAKAELGGQTRRHAFESAKEKTIKAFRSCPEYEPTFELLDRLAQDTHSKNRPLGERKVKPPAEFADEHARNRILYGPPGTGKTYGTMRHALAILDSVEVHEAEHDARRFRELLFNPKAGSGQIAMITFHQNFAYEDFVEGIRPVLGKKELRYKLRDGIFKRISRAAEEQPDERFVLIIDEINRGNIAKIFGELITLIEDSRRINREDATKVALPYSGDPFGVPDNLYIIGTMNTADRSIQLLDTALRRRFEFKEMMPQSDHPLIPPDVEGVALRRMLETMNERITLLLDREHQIGHTYLFGKNTMEGLSKTFQNKIFPLLQEYFFDDWPKIRAVLGRNGFVQERSIDVHWLDSEVMDEDRKLYERLPDDDPGWLDPAQYRKIYEAARLETKESS